MFRRSIATSSCRESSAVYFPRGILSQSHLHSRKQSDGNMEDAIGAPVGQPPDEMFKFVLQHATASETAARVGQLVLRSRPSINTPSYIVPTSRGVIPHLSQDNLQKHTRISAVYVPLEDCTFLPISAKLYTDSPGLQLVDNSH